MGLHMLYGTFPGGIEAGSKKADARFVVGLPTVALLGAPITADIDAVIDTATGTELPNTETVTYTTASIGTSPCDGVSTTWILDVPRNVVITTTHASSIVAMSFLVTGKDEYGKTMSELLTVTATGTTKTSSGKKAFKNITSIALTAAADAEANTVEVGFGDVLGLPKIMARNTILQEIEDTATATAGTVVVADATSPATTTTGDVRGTYDPNSACNGAKVFRVVYIPTSLTSSGVTQI